MRTILRPLTAQCRLPSESVQALQGQDTPAAGAAARLLARELLQRGLSPAAWQLLFACPPAAHVADRAAFVALCKDILAPRSAKVRSTALLQNQRSWLRLTNLQRRKLSRHAPQCGTPLAVARVVCVARYAVGRLRASVLQWPLPTSCTFLCCLHLGCSF